MIPVEDAESAILLPRSGVLRRFTMEDRSEEAIRERAYALWIEAGSPEGDDQRFWHEAERQLSREGELDTSDKATDTDTPPVQAGLPNL